MEKTQEILKHMFDLYNDTEYSEDEILHWCEKNMERYRAWEEAFKEFDTIDVFDAIDHYWRYNSNKTKPTVAKILAILATNKAKRIEQTSGEPAVVCFDPASRYMQRDINLGKCKCTLGKYNKAVKLIIRRLEDCVPIAELQKMDFAQKWQNVENKGLNADFDEVLEKVCAGDENIGAVTSSDDFGSVGAILAGHWRA